jgi:hypothetical protein
MATLRQLYLDFFYGDNKGNTGAEYVVFGYQTAVCFSLCHVKEICI